MDRFLSIEAFVRVAETSSFAEASRQLGVTSSVVTNRIQQLEKFVKAPVPAQDVAEGKRLYKDAVMVATPSLPGRGARKTMTGSPCCASRLRSPAVKPISSLRLMRRCA